MQHTSPAPGSPDPYLAEIGKCAAVLFLDFDGVLQTPDVEGWQDMEHCTGLTELLEQLPDLAIVVTSTHREGRSLEAVRRLLPDKVGSRVIGLTSVSALGRAHGGRQTEVEGWLAGHPGFNIWAAVDDEVFLYRDDCPWLVLTHKWIGWDERTTDALMGRLAQKRDAYATRTGMRVAPSAESAAPSI